MVQIDDADKPRLLEAVREWTGWGKSVMPRRDEAAVKSRFGAEAAGRLLPVLNALAEDFYSTNARYVAADLAQMGDIAAADFKAKYPALPAEVAEAFAWCYTFDFK
ncbi:MAG: hypothetical protein CAK89_07855 [Opitutia bacterium AMD-G3]|jgi:hypothetical protein|nr:MAG: hypothetical protein CAK89_07855 [Opitutae bacterium AMD-G3]